MTIRTSEGRPKTKTITIQQVASPARREEGQRQTLIGLGLDKMNRRKTLENTDSIWGAICKVRHMVRVVDDAKPARKAG
ncbi:MAG: 50S ribosomal protein L30 [Alphaproteobacteria bacterium]|nr:50S ribosomal protein L30 [Alphaproteobacteria bacterium]MDZ4867013.1 50S ribosomal protein L30 [Alphaproteobacteria bacterium]